jgi:phage tail protein X
MQAIALQGDTLDLICWRELGTTAGAVEQALALNPGLSDAGPLIPLGTTVILPDPAPTTAQRRETVNLWD